MVGGNDVAVTTERAEIVTDAHWALKEQLEAAIVDAKLTLRIHQLTLKSDPAAPKLTQRGRARVQASWFIHREAGVARGRRRRER